MSNPKRLHLVLTLALVLTLVPLGMVTARAQQTRTLEIWTHEFPPLQDAFTKKWIPEYEKAHPDVKIQFAGIPFAGVVAYDAKLLAGLSAGAGPDVWDMGSWEYPTFIENKFVAPLDPKVFGYDSVDDLVADYPAGSLSVFMRDGKLYGMFSELDTLALFYNLDMFEKAGIKPLAADKPASWDEIGKIGEKLRQTDSSGALKSIGYQFGFFAAFRSQQWYAQDYYAILRQYGQNDLYVNGKPAANTPAAIKAFQVISDFTYKYKAYDPTFLANWFADFPNNRVAMVLAGTWFAPAIRQQKADVRFGVAPHPVVDPANKDSYANIVWSWGWSTNPNKDADQQKLAQEFLAFILGKKGQADQPVYWFANLGYLQPRKAFLESQGYKDALKKDPWLQLFDDAYKKYKVEYVQHSYDEAGAALVRAIDRIIYDKMSPQDTAKLLQAELERLGS
jgi:ABC-type glycerol-3-phosphate transport system substrate-binding protein